MSIKFIKIFHHIWHLFLTVSRGCMMHLRRGTIFNNHLTKHLLLRLTVKEFSKPESPARGLRSSPPASTASLTVGSSKAHVKMAKEIDLEKCTFCNFGSSVTLTLDRVEVILVRICGRGLPTHQIRWKSEKLFVDVRTYGRTYGRTHLSSNLLGHR